MPTNRRLLHALLARRLWAPAAVGVALAVVAVATWPGQALRERAALAAACLVLPTTALLAAEVVRSRRELARARAESAEARERLRLAGELHDVVGHSMAGIGVQSSAALHLLNEEQAEAVAALRAIRTASRAALRELQSTTGLLHGESPGLDRLDALLDAMRQAGLAVRPERDGEPAYLPAPLSHAAYRIAQEALTNVLRHAGPSATATIQIGYGRAELTLRVTDDGPSPAEQGPESGIAAMRARAEAHGGTLTAGPGDEGGFEVTARLPLTPP